MSVRAWGQLYIQDSTPSEDPVIVGSVWSDTLNGTIKVCTSVSPYTFASVGGSAHNLLSATHTDTLAATVVRGDLIRGNSTPAWARLAIGATQTVLTSDGSDPAWSGAVTLATSLTAPLVNGSTTIQAGPNANQPNTAHYTFGVSTSSGLGFSSDEFGFVFGSVRRLRIAPDKIHIAGSGGADQELVFGPADGDARIRRTAASTLKIEDATTGRGCDLFLTGKNSDNGEEIKLQSLSEETTIAAAAFTDTTIQIPAGALVLQVGVRVTTVIPTAATFDVGVAGATTRYGTGISVAANTTNTSAGTTNPTIYASAVSVRITPDLSPAANTGRVRVTIMYLAGTAPTS